MRPRRRAPRTALEREFQDVYDAYGKDLCDLLDRLKEISDKTGIPYGTYVPKSFKQNYLDDLTYEANQAMVDFVGQVAPVDQEFWQSSTAECEVFY